MEAAKVYKAYFYIKSKGRKNIYKPKTISEENT